MVVAIVGVDVAIVVIIAVVAVVVAAVVIVVVCAMMIGGGKTIFFDLFQVRYITGCIQPDWGTKPSTTEEQSNLLKAPSTSFVLERVMKRHDSKLLPPPWMGRL